MKRYHFLKTGCLALAGLLSACGTPDIHRHVVTGPTSIRPDYFATPIQNRNPGAIYQADSAQLLYEEPMARRIGDILTIQISETLTGSNKATTNTSQTLSAAMKGPESGSGPGSIKALFGIDKNTSSNRSDKASGQNDSSQSLTGSLTVSIIDILPNGNFVVGGDKRVSLDDNIYTLRFSGIVNRQDIKQGNVVNSSRVADARIEKLGDGPIQDVNTLTWMQRLFLSVIGLN